MRAIVIMAGGTGERFWPLSRRNHPKQLLALSGSGRSMLAETVERAAAIVPRENVYVATSRILQAAIRDAALGIPDENVIAEPCKRNTLGCILYATACIKAKASGDVTLGFMAADARIPDTAHFIATVSQALQAAEDLNGFVTIGIKPERPETGYGYIEVDKKALVENPAGVLDVVRFREKPDAASAADFVASGNFFWNSGMFFWKASEFVSELAVQLPSVAETFKRLQDAVSANDDASLNGAFESLPNISIDYALIEKARKIRVIQASFSWDDLGAWDSLDRTCPRDENGNVAIGSPVMIDSKDCIVYNAPGAENVAVGVLGMEKIVVVVSKDAVLVVPKERAQEVKKIVVALQEKGAKQI